MYSQSLIIADLQSHTLGGHFKTWLDRSLLEASKYFKNIAVYIADDFSRPEERVLQYNNTCQITAYLIPEVYSQKKIVGDILSVVCKHACKSNSVFSDAPVFIMWAQQFLERDLIYQPLSSWLPWRRVPSFNRSWGSLTSISWAAFDRESAHPTEKAVHDLVQAEASCRGVFLWDSFSVEKFPEKYIYLPNVEETIDDPQWAMPVDSPPQIGSVGQLWGYRSVNLLAQVLKFESGVKAYLAGVPKPESYSEEAHQLLKNPSVLVYEEGFVEQDSELNERLRKLDAFLIDGRTYKCPSGLGIRAMAMGRPLVSPDSPSWAASLIRENGVGVFWEPGKNTLAADLRSWYAGGGSQRAVKVAQKLNDRKGLEEAYVKMFDRLCGV